MNTGIKATFTGTDEDRRLFTPAEWKVFLKHCEGYTKKAIADYICRSEGTIRTQDASIREKSHVNTMTQAIVKAVAKGIVTITTACLIFGSVISTFTDNESDDDLRRAPRTVRSSRTNRSFRDYIV